MMHASLPARTFSMHMTLADVVDAHSQSSELLCILSKVGAVAGLDYYKRYRQTVVDECQQQGLNIDIPDGRFSLATVDSIDKNTPNKQMYWHDVSRGFHGTSIQSVTLKPVTGITQAPASCPEPHMYPLNHQPNAQAHIAAFKKISMVDLPVTLLHQMHQPLPLPLARMTTVAHPFPEPLVRTIMAAHQRPVPQVRTMTAAHPITAQCLSMMHLHNKTQENLDQVNNRALVLFCPSH